MSEKKRKANLSKLIAYLERLQADIERQDMSGDEYAIQSLGEDIGYGELMSIASRLWREYLKNLGVGESGAFVPVIIQNGVMIDESGARFTLTPLDIEAGRL